MKKVGNFQTEDPKRLSEQLDRFQDAVVQEASNIRAGFIPQLEQRRFTATTAVGATLLVGQIALCDSTTGDVTVVLSATRPGWSAIVKRQAANAVNVFASGMTGLVSRKINTVSSVAISAVGPYWVYFDGSDWWV